MAHHLSKIKVIRNTNYKPSGPGSYVFMMQRYAKHGMKPTMPGPIQLSASQKVVKTAADGTSGEVYEALPITHNCNCTDMEAVGHKTNRTTPAISALFRSVPRLRP